MAAPFNKFYPFSNNLAQGAVDLDTDTLKVMLTNTLPVATDGVYGDLSATELAPGNGYVTGGAPVTRLSAGEIGGFYTLVVANTQFVAAGPMGPFRYPVLYSLNTSIVNKPLIGWWDYGSPLTLLEGAQFIVAFDPNLGVVNLQ